MKKYPLRFRPQVRPALWGRELWLVSGVADQPSVVANGAYAGQTLPQLVSAFGRELTGVAGDRFPLLVKIIEAEDRLSLQVHPNTATAAQSGGDPKTEMWYVLAGRPDAFVYAGLKRGVDRARLADALRDGSAERLLERIPARCGETVFIPGGLVHAIGEGCRLYEVQQTSDTTWRLYDWNRVDAKTGQPRHLHVREGLDAIDWDASALLSSPGIGTRVACAHFRFSRFELAASQAFPPGKSFRIVFSAEGSGTVIVDGAAPERLAPDTCLLLPSGMGFHVSPDGAVTLLIAEIPCEGGEPSEDSGGDGVG